MSLGGGLGLPMGDTISPPAAITLFTVPLIAMIGLSLVAIAAGYDAAVARWTEPANADAETRRWTTPPSAGI